MIKEENDIAGVQMERKLQVSPPGVPSCGPEVAATWPYVLSAAP